MACTKAGYERAAFRCHVTSVGDHAGLHDQLVAIMGQELTIESLVFNKGLINTPT